MIKIFKNLSRRDFILFALAVAMIVTQVWLDLTLPDYMSDITTLIETEGSKISEVLQSGGKMLLCALGSMASACATAVIAAKIAADFSANTRKKIYDSVQSFSMAEIRHFSTASLVTRTTNDVTQVQMLIVMGMQAMVKAPIEAVWAIVKISDKSWQWTLSTGIAVILLLFIIGITLALCLPRFRKIQKLTDDLNRVTRENLTGLKVIHAYNAEDYQNKKFGKINDELTRTNLFTGRATALLLPVFQAVMSGLTLAIYWIGAVIIDQAELSEKLTLFSDMVVFSSYAIQVVMAFMMLVVIFILYPRASVSAKRILEITDTKPSIEDGTETAGFNGQEGTVEFRNVSFHYPDASEDVLQNISFKAKKGQTVALIGSTGCGKSSAVNLIPRFYDATKGEVLIDGRNVKEYTQEALHDRIGYISQDTRLFRGSVKSNIAYGDNGQGEPSVDDLNLAVKVSEAENFINEKEDGMESYVSQNGRNFSGGQRQRIAIARAIARKPEILIFDDSFSALDYKTDRKVRDNLKKYCKGVTKIIVAQRIGTIRDADTIIVLSDGKVAGIGTHDELMKTCETYQEIALSQLSREELA